MFNGKKLIGIILFMVFALTILTAGISFAEEKPITVVIDGEMVEFDAQPIMKNDRVMVPVRKVFEKLSAEVLWDPFFERVIINSGESDQIIMYINEEEVYKNGIQINLDVPAFISEGRTYVPLRFISENLNMKVEWSDANYTVYIVPEHKGMQYIPFGEFLTIPCPYSVNRNYKTLEYENKNGVATAKYTLNGESEADFERYTLIMEANGYKNIKKATEKDREVIYFGNSVVLKLTLPDDEGIFSISLYEDSAGESVKEYLK